MSVKHPLAKMFAYDLALLGVGLIVGTLGPLLGDLAGRTGTTLQAVSVLLALRPLGYLGGTLWSGRLLERRPGHPVLALAALAAAGLLALVPAAPSLKLAGLLILAMGVAQGLLDVGSNSLMTWVFHEKVGPALSGLHFSFGLGAFLAPLVVTALPGLGFGRLQAFRAVALYLVPLAVLFLLVPSPPHARESAAAAAPPVDRRLAGFLLACFYLYGGSEAGFGQWIYQYTLRFHPGSAARAGVLNSLFWGLLGLGRLLGIPVLARFTPKAFLAVILPGALLAFAAAWAWPGSLGGLTLSAAAGGAFMACVFPTLQVFAGRRLAGGGRVGSRLTSFFFVGSATGSITLPWLMGQLFEPVGPRSALAVPALGLALLLACYLVVLRLSRA